MSRETQLVFIRHGEQPLEGSLHDSGLTGVGREEARKVGEELKLDRQYTLAFSVENTRSLGSTVLALKPAINDSEVAANVHELLHNGNIKTLASLSYLPIEDKELDRKLEEAFDNKKNLHFLVHESDNYRLKTGREISSYTTTAHEVAKIIRKYYTIHNHWKRISISRELNSDLYRIFCAREFIYPCFRAKIVENQCGIEARDSYVEWYGDNVELLDSARTDISSIKIYNEGATVQETLFQMEDGYGSLTFNIKDIEQIINDYNDRFQVH